MVHGQAPLRLALAGLGNVGRPFLKLLVTQKELLTERFGLRCELVAAGDRSGVMLAEGGLDPMAVLRFKTAAGGLAASGALKSGLDMPSALERIKFDLVVDATPVDLNDGQPGMSIVRTALRQGKDAVLANKGPLVLAYGELTALARRHGARLRFSATVCGPLPAVNLGRRDLVASKIECFRGVLNATTNFILAEMEAGRGFEAALERARAVGAAERDPRLDVEGWDAAAKLVIVANSVLNVPAVLGDVQTTGIVGVTPQDLSSARRRGQTIKLLAEARRCGDRYALSVGPVALPRSDFLAGCRGWEMGVEFHSDLYGPLFVKVREREPGPTAAALLRDIVALKGRPGTDL